jgi:hypothetical protein
VRNWARPEADSGFRTPAALEYSIKLLGKKKEEAFEKLPFSGVVGVILG